MRKLANDELGRLSVEDYKQASKMPICIILDDVRSLNNIGSIFRTADAFRIEKIYLCGITATPPHRDIRKTALGSTESVGWEYDEDVLNVIHNLHQKGYKIYAIEQADESISLHDFRADKNEKIALIFGNEVKGVCDEAVNQSDACIEIPQFGTKHSLNISVSMGVVVWEIFNKMEINFG